MNEVKGRKFEIVKEYRECFDLEDLDGKYIEEIFDKYEYIVGDYSAGLLRIKGFYHNNKEDNYKHIPDYLNESCAFGCPFYILKKIKGGKKHDRNWKNS